MYKKSWKQKLSVVIAGILTAGAVNMVNVFDMTDVSAASSMDTYAEETQVEAAARVSSKKPQKLTATYSAKEVKKKVGDKLTQRIKGAKTKVVYTSSNKNVAKITKVNRENGNRCEITCVGAGRTVITAKAWGDSEYKESSKRFTLYVLPKTAKIVSLKSNAKGQVTIISNDAAKGSDGYEILYKHNGKTTRLQVKGRRPLARTIRDLRSGRRFQVRIRTYKERKGEMYYGRYSRWKTLDRVW